MMESPEWIIVSEDEYTQTYGNTPSEFIKLSSIKLQILENNVINGLCFINGKLDTKFTITLIEKHGEPTWVKHRTCTYYYKSGKVREKNRYNAGDWYHVDKPAREGYYESGQPKVTIYTHANKRHRHATLLTYATWHENGQVSSKNYYSRDNGELHNECGPAHEQWDEAGNSTKRLYFIYGKKVPAFSMTKSAGARFTR